MQNIFSLEGKIIIVTGATGVLGQAFINGIAEAGGIVGILGRNKTVAEERAATIIGKGGKAVVLIADVTNEEQLKAARDKVLSAYGKIDGLVNAAGGNQPGAVIPPDQSLFNLNMEALQQVMGQQAYQSYVKSTEGQGRSANRTSPGTVFFPGAAVRLNEVVDNVQINVAPAVPKREPNP